MRCKSKIAFRILALLVWIATTTYCPSANAQKGCPPGTVKVGEREERPEPNVIIVHPVCQQLPVAQPSPTKSPLTDFAVMVTPDKYECESASRRLAQLHNLETKFESKQAELAKWRGDMLAEKREFDRLHADAARGELSEVIAIIPSDAVVGHLLGRGLITAESAEKLKVLFERLKDAGKAAANAMEARNEKELAKVQIDVSRDVYKELIRISSDLPLDSPERLWELRTVKLVQMFGATAKAMLGTLPANEAPWWERVEPGADLAADIAGIAFPEFVGPAVAIERVGGREIQKMIVSRAQDSLGGAIADNWNAGLYLSQKLERVKGDMVETQRTITACGSGLKQNLRRK